MYRRASLIIVAVAACHSAQSIRPPAEDGGGSEGAGLDAFAEISDATAADDGSDSTTGSDASIASDAYVYPGSDAGTPGVVSCYSEGNPTATCTLPQHCCFTNYSAQHNGACGSSTCAWGTIECDGPEDCSAGGRCCAHVMLDQDNSVIGYRMACQQNACGAAPANEELCHPTTMAAGTCSAGTCVNTLGVNNDLPRTLDVCR